MAKYDSVDRLMDLATNKAVPRTERNPAEDALGETIVPSETPAATDAVEPGMDPLAASVMATEPGLPRQEATVHQPESQRSTALGQPRITPAERGRQLLSALRPFLPAVGGALRLVDHGAAQAAARLLPMLGGISFPAAGPAPAAQANAPTQEDGARLSELLLSMDKRQRDTVEELKKTRAALDLAEEQIRRLREGLERTVAEQGALSHLTHQLADRSRVLTAASVILFMLVVAEVVLLAIFLHR